MIGLDKSVLVLLMVPCMDMRPHQRQAGIDLRWLIRLRWGAVVGQCVTICTVQWWLNIELPNAALFGLVGLEIASNLALAYWTRTKDAIQERSTAALMALDVIILTGLLYFSGGPSNPFNFLYLVYLALGTLVLSMMWSWALVGLSLICFGLLFIQHQPLSGHHAHMAWHLEGMWVAFGVAALFIVTFIQRLRRILEAHATELRQARRRSVQREKLASLATLAAGAAHELATPLAVIAVAAKELLRRQEDDTSPSQTNLRQDLELIRHQVTLCGDILKQMAADSGSHAHEGHTQVHPKELCQDALAGLPEKERIIFNTETMQVSRFLNLPRQDVVRALRSVLKNALDATGDNQGSVRLHLEQNDANTIFSIQDQGPGMQPDILDQALEPFFTTKDPGAGMGLGLFLTQEVVHRIGGVVHIASNPGAGCHVTLEIPNQPPSTQATAPTISQPKARTIEAAYV
jgi:two-component system, sensor histidine kinase RegB